MEYEIVEEVKLVDGEKKVWYLVEPKNKIRKFFHSHSTFHFSNLSLHLNKEEAIEEAKLKTEGNWDRTISRKKI